MFGIIFLATAALMGIGLIYRVFKGYFAASEMILSGTLIGWIISLWGAYGLAKYQSEITIPAIAALTGLQTIAACYLLFPLRQLRWEGIKAFFVQEWHLIGLLSFFFPLYNYLFQIRMFSSEADGLYSGGNSWNDMCLHLGISTSFAYGKNFPPIYTPYAPEPLRYPFLPDFQNAILLVLGHEPWSALVITGVTLSLLITGLFYCLARRICQAAELPRSEWTAILAVVLFLFNGGLGFLYFFEDWRTKRLPFQTFWDQLEKNYANMWDINIHWSNLIVDTFLPQRASLYGIPIALVVFTVFVIIWQRWHAPEPRDRWDAWQLLLPAGILTGATPLFHMQTYMTIGLISGALFLLKPRRTWLIFWLPAIALALPQVLGTLGGHVSQSTRFFWWEPGWKGHDEVSWALYVLRNFGLPALLLWPAWYHTPRPWRKFYLPFFALIVFCLCVMVSPHDYDNMKLMIYWWAMTAILLAAWLVRLADQQGQRFLAALLIFACIASGLLAVKRESLLYWRTFSASEVKAAQFVRENTDPHALFLTGPVHNQPIMALAGRQILMGFQAWLWTHGYDFRQREQDVKEMLRGGDRAKKLLEELGVDYVYIAPRELGNWPFDQNFYRQNYPTVFQNSEVTIYQIHKESR